MAPPARPSLQIWLPFISTAALIAGLLLTCGGYIQQLKDLVAIAERHRSEIQQLDVRIAKLEARADDNRGDRR